MFNSYYYIKYFLDLILLCNDDLKNLGLNERMSIAKIRRKSKYFL